MFTHWDIFPIESVTQSNQANHDAPSHVNAPSRQNVDKSDYYAPLTRQFIKWPNLTGFKNLSTHLSIHSRRVSCALASHPHNSKRVSCLKYFFTGLSPHQANHAPSHNTFWMSLLRPQALFHLLYTTFSPRLIPTKVIRPRFQLFSPRPNHPRCTIFPCVRYVHAPSMCIDLRCIIVTTCYRAVEVYNWLLHSYYHSRGHTGWSFWKVVHNTGDLRPFSKPSKDGHFDKFIAIDPVRTQNINLTIPKTKR